MSYQKMKKLFNVDLNSLSGQCKSLHQATLVNNFKTSIMALVEVIRHKSSNMNAASIK